MKQLIENLKNLTDGLGNLNEKDGMKYEDVIVEELSESERVKEFEDIAGELAEMVSAHKFDDDDDDGTHPFLSCPKELVRTIGIDEIMVCPYKGQIHNPWLDSNFMWHKHDDGYSCLTIDVYCTHHAPKDFVCEDILQELYNFKRDAEWAVDGVYEEEMRKMEF